MCLATYNPGRVSLSRCGIPLWSTPSVLSGIADFLHTFYRPQSCPASPPSGRKGIPFHSIESATRLVRRFQAVQSWEEIPSNKSFVPSPSSSVCGMLKNDEELGGGQKKLPGRSRGEKGCLRIRLKSQFGRKYEKYSKYVYTNPCPPHRNDPRPSPVATGRAFALHFTQRAAVCWLLVESWEKKVHLFVFFLFRWMIIITIMKYKMRRICTKFEVINYSGGC